MKKSRLLILAIALIASAFTTVKAQQEETQGKPNVVLDYFEHPSNISQQYADVLRNALIQAITETQRVNLIDVATNSALKAEDERIKSLQESGQLSSGGDADRLQVMTQEGANFLIQGIVDNLSMQEKTLDSGSKYYEAAITFTLKVINPKDGKLLSSETFKVGDDLINLTNGDTPDLAIVNTCRKSAGKIKKFVDKNFPVVGKILEIGEVKKDEAKTLYVSVGSNVGVVKGDRFEVKKVRTIAGRTSASKIGEIEIEAVEGDDISLAKVKKEGKAIKEAIDADDTLIIVSVPKGGGILGSAKGAVGM